MTRTGRWLIMEGMTVSIPIAVPGTDTMGAPIAGSAEA
jgi:hypothetical protein